MQEVDTSSDIEFEISQNSRCGPNNTTYHVVNVGCCNQHMTKSLADCGNATDARNGEFAEWIKRKLEEAIVKGEYLPFLRERPVGE